VDGDHAQFRALVSYKPSSTAKATESWFLRFDENGHAKAGFLPTQASAQYPDPDARFFSEIVGGSLVECYFGSIEEIGEAAVTGSVYCLQSNGVDGNGAGAIVEVAATCALAPDERNEARTHFAIFDEKHVVAADLFTLGLDCATWDHAGERPASVAAVPRTSHARQPRPSSPPAQKPSEAPSQGPSTASRTTSPTRGLARDEGVVIAATNDENFMIETLLGRHLFNAKTYCFSVNEGDRVVFSESPEVCVTNTFIDRTSGDKCEVWCE
jgi:hypothetical protein